MSQALGLAEEIEAALRDASPDRRSSVLRRVTDLFIHDAESLTADQTALFDDVLGQLVAHLESRAAVELSRRLAPVANAPFEMVRCLACHDDIAISGPVLERSGRLSDDDLIRRFWQSRQKIAKQSFRGSIATVALNNV